MGMEFSGALYDVVSRGNDRLAVVRDEAERRRRLGGSRRSRGLLRPSWRRAGVLRHRRTHARTPVGRSPLEEEGAKSRIAA
jgi:hypothetical protein